MKNMFITLLLLAVFLSGCASGNQQNDSLPAEEKITAHPAVADEPENNDSLSPEEKITDHPAIPDEPEKDEEAGDRNYQRENGSVVYFTEDISPEGLLAVYQALGAEPQGRIAVKITTGEPPNSNYLKPELIKDLVQSLDGTLVECNTAYGGRRGSNKYHMQVVEDHGFLDIATVDILDADAEISLPVIGGEVLSENFVGANFINYDYYVVLSHFKGHQMAGYGGAIKNISIGIASKAGKIWIHSGGTRTSGGISGNQHDFLKSMAEAGKSVSDSLDGNILYINVMNQLSIDCDCNGRPAEPDMHDVGILASFDPVALDQACIDLVAAAPDSETLMKRINQQDGIITIIHAAGIGLGNREYTLVNIDD